VTSHTALDQMTISPRIKQSTVWIAGLSLVAVLAWQAHRWAMRQGYERLDDEAAGKLDLYASAIDNELGKHAYLACLLAADADLQRLLLTPSNAPLQSKVSLQLARTSVAAGVLGVWLLNQQGQILSASDSYRQDNRYGLTLAQHSAVAQALKGQESRGFATPPASAASEYFFACPTQGNAATTGAVVVGVSLAPMEATWIGLALRRDSDKPVVVDQTDTIILSSVPQWKHASVRLLLSRSSTLPSDTHPYWSAAAQQAHQAAIQAMVRTARDAPAFPVVIYRRELPRFGWQLLVYSDAAELGSTAQLAAWGAAAVGSVAMLLGLVWQQRRRVLAQKLATRQALQQANDQLEMTVQQRTQELQNSNQDLQHEITVRHHAEAVLREAQNELVQASKMALLGQMSASISHEVGQPLTAMRALADNARLLLARGQSKEALDNLTAITEMVERMGRITAQLKSFAKKSASAQGQVHLADAVRNAFALLDARLRQEQVHIVMDVSEHLWAHCDGNRLEQVLINLMVNAIDAMQTIEHKMLSVRAWTEANQIKVRISDTGSGIAASLREHLFEPFFTTKASGLGLGLVISAHIVKEFGGDLQAVDSALGAAFEFAIPLLTPS
jgi:C4-dicarboxylate-specific signal transduction histidine kinase